MTELSNIVAFPHAGTSVWIDGYQQDCLDARCGEATVDAYVRILRQFTAWVAKLPGQGGQFVPSQLTTTAVERYLSALKEQGYSVSHRTRVKTVINGFCQWLIEEKQALIRNPTRGVEIKAQQVLAPRILSPDQRFVLHNLLEKEADLRGKAIFALGCWAGLRPSGVRVSPKMAFTNGSGASSGRPTTRNGNSSLLSRFMICAMILRIVPARLAGRWKRSPIIWGM